MPDATDGAKARLALGWAVGAAVSIAGMFASYQFDLPTGATVVTTFGLALMFALGWRALGVGR
jgi:zinc/manganese transport system permease protein